MPFYGSVLCNKKGNSVKSPRELRLALWERGEEVGGFLGILKGGVAKLYNIFLNIGENVLNVFSL